MREAGRLLARVPAPSANRRRVEVVPVEMTPRDRKLGKLVAPPRRAYTSALLLAQERRREGGPS